MKIKIVYATEVGTTKYVAEIMQKKLIDQNQEVVLHQLGVNGPNPDLGGLDLVIFGSPTYYNGQVQDEMAKYLAHFQGDLSKHQVAIFALGDRGYHHFCGAAEILENWVEAHQGKLLLPTLKIDGFPHSTDAIIAWVEKLLAKSKK